jgi:CheY-specific phosphatase CheX
MNFASTKQHSILNNLYRDAASELLGDKVEVSAEKWNDAADIQGYVSLLGATDEELAISSMIRVSKHTLASLHPLGVSELSDEALEDWCRELNNQLVGRMKNKLLSYGVAITLGLPVLLAGTDLTLVATPDTNKTEHRIDTPFGPVVLILQTLVDPALVLEKQNRPDEAALLEGVVSLF